MNQFILEIMLIDVFEISIVNICIMYFLQFCDKNLFIIHNALFL